MPRTPYTPPAVVPKPLSDRQWALVAPIIAALDPLAPRPHPGRHRGDPRGVLDALLYRAVTGCPYNRLPDRFPDDSVVHRTYQRWRARGVLAAVAAAVMTEPIAAELQEVSL